MSSESSVSMSTGDSSRLRQFGLYRTIDARTEEFLRQSRRRQIRQGCVCATVSTVITVTVVIIVILVYVKNGPSKDSNKTIVKASWIGLLNDSLSSPFEEKLRKSKLNLDKSTIKLLPLLLEALKQNKFLEKILEDYSSSSTSNEGKTTTEYAFKKNAFADAKTWTKTPTSRFYAIEYKTTPLVYFKKPTGKLAYISKIRKIRDYKKILQQVGKIMSGKMDHDSPEPIDRLNTETKKLSKVLQTSSNKFTNPKKISKTSQSKVKIKEQTKNVIGCNCQISELSVMINKLLSSFQQLLPDVVSNAEDAVLKPATGMESVITTNSIKSKLPNKNKASTYHMSEFSNVFQGQETKNSDVIENNFLKEKSTISPVNLKLESKKVNVSVTTVKHNIGPTEIHVTQFPTKPIVLPLFNFANKDLLTTISPEKYLHDTNFTIKKDNNSYAKGREDAEYNADPISVSQGYIKTTTYKPIADVISEFDINSLELFKSRILPSNRHLSTAKNFTKSNVLRNATSVSYNIKKIPSYNQVLQKEEARYEPSVSQEDYGFESRTETLNHEVTSKKIDLKSIILKVKSELNAEKKQSRSQNFVNTVKEYDEVNKEARDDDYHEEFNEKSPESMTSISLSLSNNTVVDSDLNTNKQRHDFWSFLNSNYDRSKMKSMIPLNRPTYLEIHRNNWNVEDTEDFDVILLIYEYAIAIETSLVQIKKKANRRASEMNATNDSPVADRLDRSYFGFDQDYYERMPLLVNALQENNYVDPTLDDVGNKGRKQKAKSLKVNSNYLKPPPLRRTSPRPFIFEYKSPTPVPFSKTYGSKSWVESYRNAQRLQNIQQVIKYLEKTINAKFGDMYSVPSSQHIAFTGIYVEPSGNEKLPIHGSEQSNLDLIGESSKRVDIFKSNHKSDPLFKYKPDSPGEVNLLADSFLRFSPTFIGKHEHFSVPMFRPIPSQKKPCQGHSCEKIDQNTFGTSSSETRIPDSSNFNKPKTFSVMLNLFPIKPKLEHSPKIQERPRSVFSDKIYITTSKPFIHFKRKANTSTKRRTISVKRPRILNDERKIFHNLSNESDSRKKNYNVSSASNMIVQINLYTPERNTEITTQSNNVTEPFTTTTSTIQANHFTPMTFYTTDIPINLSTTQVEDFHIGSSGIIPIEHRTLPPPPAILPPSTTYQPPFDVTISSTEGAWYTKPPEILKFGHEDAKISDEYKRYRELDFTENTYTNRRNSKDQIEMHDIEQQTIMPELRNRLESTTLEVITEENYSHEETTTASTTTQINGHYRNVNKKNFSKFLSTLLDPNSEMNRKRRLNLLAKGFRRPDFSLSYTEIKRKKTHVADSER